MKADELIRELPKGLINWYDFCKEGKVLFVTGGMLQKEALCEEAQEELLTEALRNAGLYVTAINFEEIVCGAGKTVYNEKFDYVLMVGVLEYCTEPEKLLTILYGLLKEDGRLLLGMDNRLGIRYFCGDKDAFTGRNFDGIENYYQVNGTGGENISGRAYAKAEIVQMLEKAGFVRYRFYSVLPELSMPQLIYAEDYLPEEELDIRYFPSYRSPETIFLEEERLYTTLIQNGLFHVMANSFLIECTMDGALSNVKQVTVSMDRGKENALATIIRRDSTVIKRALYHEGREKLGRIIANDNDLRKHGLSVISAELKADDYVMPYIQGEIALDYFRRLLIVDKEKFLAELDVFYKLILKSSEHVAYEEIDWEHFEPDWGKRKGDDPERDKWRKVAFGDKPDGLGVILKRGYIDLVPLNCFRIDQEFLFYDQEFFMDNLPANVILWRTIDLIYGRNFQLEAILPRQKVQEKYHLNEHSKLWQRFAGKFVYELRNMKELSGFHQIHHTNLGIVHSNRQRMNYSENEYQRVFRDLFHNTEGKKLYLFGSGNYTKKFISQFGKDYEFSGILDNNPGKWNTQMEGVAIYSPEILKELRPEEYKVIICIKNYVPVLNQLKQLGIRNYGIYDWNLEYPRKVKPIAVTGNDGKKAPKKYHTGYIAGVFDLFHVGHLNMFKRAKEQCDYLIVGVVTDESVIRDKKTSPYIPFEERIEMVRSCRYVDEAVEIPPEFGDTDEAYRRYRFDVQFSGSDYENDPEWLAKKVFLQKQGSDLVFFPYTQSTSSTKLKQMISKKLL